MHKLLFTVVLLPLFSIAQLSVVELTSKEVPMPISRDAQTEAFNRSLDGYAQLSTPVKDILYWTNYSRANPGRFWDSVVVPILAAFPSLKGKESKSLELDLRAISSLPLFSLNSKLVQTAQNHAADIARHKASPSHTSTNGVDFGARMQSIGIKKCANENIALGGHNNLLSLVLLYLDIGLPDKGHRKTLLNDGLREIGIGHAFYGNNQFFIVQDFACSQN